ncbi:MAG TPA: AbrB/MazE/SpoVT family DNA-binding domain-containing protein [Usitatibacter sp.]|jgi:antitoxin component of MazEF toxin-antitoxin module|nr:AbrB/MazE/SpoVT family DNA-binding domain-containing protein [Usitatibacter sp.]
MRLTIRRIGNSLGVIVPRETLRRWGLDEGDSLELSGEAIRRPRRGTNSQLALDRFKRALALEVLRRYALEQVRERSLANLARWQKAGAWNAAHAEWRQVLAEGTDAQLLALMAGEDEHANQLRQSMPFVGMLPPDVREKLREEAPARSRPARGRRHRE